VPDFRFALDRLACGPHEFSGGEQQLLGLAAALFARPDLLLLDEPTSKLAAALRERAWAILESSVAVDATMLLVSHDKERALSFAHREVELGGGRVTYDGPPRTERVSRRGEVVDRLDDLPTDMRSCGSEWWRPGDFFHDNYILGDHSNEGAMGATHRTRDQRTKREARAVIDICKHYIDGRLGSVLDVPTGTGRHAAELASLGIDVTGVDLNERYLEAARRASPSSRFVLGDMRELAGIEPDTFDAAVNLNTSFGFFGSEGDDQRTLTRMRGVIRVGGLVLIHLDYNTAGVMDGVSTELAFRTLEGGGRLFVREIYCREDGCLHGRWQVLSRDDVASAANYSLRVYSDEQWHSLAKGAGLVVRAILGSLDAPYARRDSESLETVIVMQRSQ
jgi:SAM-dependent methyltransferase